MVIEFLPPPPLNYQEQEEVSDLVNQASRMYWRLRLNQERPQAYGEVSTWLHQNRGDLPTSDVFNAFRKHLFEQAFEK